MPRLPPVTITVLPLNPESSFIAGKSAWSAFEAPC